MKTTTEKVIEKFIEAPFLKFSLRNYKEYGIAVLEDRAVPAIQDGLKPVHRRAIWAAHSLGANSTSRWVKSARVVGDVIGRFHPHGDCLRGDTIVPLLNGETPTIKELAENYLSKKWVLSYDSKTKKYVRARAYAWRLGQITDTFYRITLNTGDVLEATGNHKFFTERGQIEISNLTMDDILIGGYTYHISKDAVPHWRIFAIEKIVLKHKEEFYDFTVDGYANMIVCPAGNPSTFVVVHNSSAYGAIVGMTNVGKSINNIPIGLFEGGGNWGSWSSHTAAAYRYTELKLSKFTDSVLLNPFYLPVIEYGPNFDDSTVEPLVLPALLPILFLNGSSGMAPGARSEIPSCTLKSVIQTLNEIYSGLPITPELLYRNLRFRSCYGALEDKPIGSEVEERKSIFKTMKGSVLLHSNFKEVKPNVWEATTFGPVADSPSIIDRIRNRVSSVVSVEDSSDSDSKFGKLTVVFKRGVEDSDIEKVRTILDSKENYILNLTDRYVDEKGLLAARLFNASLTEAFKKWIEFRIDLEVKACSYWIEEYKIQLAKTKLLMLAVDNVDIILKSLKRKEKQLELEIWLAKELKISVEDAKTIYSLQVRQLRSLEREPLEEKEKSLLAKSKKLDQRRKDPFPFMKSQLNELFLPEK